MSRSVAAFVQPALVRLFRHSHLAGESAPWYGSARVFRPNRTAEWSPVIEEISAALASRAHGNVPRPP